jgi:hypothetical protein
LASVFEELIRCQIGETFSGLLMAPFGDNSSNLIVLKRATGLQSGKAGF